MPYKNFNDKRRLLIDYKYENSERGFLIRLISNKFNKKQKDWKPSIDRQEFWLQYLNHKESMQHKFKNSDGCICRYCEKPFTFIRKMGTRGGGYQGRKTQTYSNVSIDRFDPRLSYNIDNIVFCCVGCNDRKRNSNPNDWKNFIRVGREMKTGKY